MIDQQAPRYATVHTIEEMLATLDHVVEETLYVLDVDEAFAVAGKVRKRAVQCALVLAEGPAQLGRKLPDQLLRGGPVLLQALAVDAAPAGFESDLAAGAEAAGPLHLDARGQAGDQAPVEGP